MQLERTKRGFAQCLLVPCQKSQTHNTNIIIKDSMVAMDVPKEIVMIAIKEPLCNKGDLYDCNHRGPIVSSLIL